MALARLAVVGVIFLLFAPAVGAQFSQVAKLRASDGGTKDFFGASVAADGNTVVIGAQGYAPQYGNAAYVFEPSDADPAHWGEVKKLVPHTPADFFGGSVAINGDIIIVGAWQPGHQFEGENAYIFYRDAGGADNWGVVRELDRDDDDFGNAVAVSGDTVVVGAQKARVSSTTFAGAAYIFQRNLGGADNWGEVIKLVAPVPGEYAYFGCAVAINGDTVIVGECYPDSRYPGAGSAYVFQRDAGGTNNWGLVTQLVPTDGHDGDFFGNSVAISGDTAVIGAPKNENAGTYSGAGYVFERDLGGVDNWGQVAKVVPLDGEYQDEFGTSVAVDGDTLVVGSPSDDDPDGWEGRWDVGSAYVFARDEGGADNWGQVTKVFGIGGMHEDLFGESVAISGGLVVGGSRGDDDLEYESGSVHVFHPHKDSAVAYLVGELNRPRIAHTATLLLDGQVLMAGGIGVGGLGLLAEAELYDPTTGFWSQTGSMNAPRDQFTATLLPNGRLLAVGGFVDISPNIGSCELYNPAAEAWVFTDSQIVASAWHTATLLNDGRVLVAGGFNNFGNATNRAEVYDPTTGLWTETGSLITARYKHTATLLQDGRVLVAGGAESVPSRLDSAEIYDPTTETWTATGYLGVARGGGHTATLLHDGRVLVIGGIELSYDGPDTNTELFDPASGTWSPTGQLNTSREDHSATLLRDGRVLLVGGSTDKENHGGPGEEASTELYDPVSGRWSPGIYMNQRRSGHTATLLPGNPLEQVVLIAGGTYDDGWLDSTEVWEDVPLFADGFETGDTSEWSSTFP